ncbi:unnamed protein product [Toxocara canis]|uniref:Uncharacterized protein n=1 Tax=Toxocara canis TaxID=6265 RepID=A0A183VH75_TOXCA|nr:unnamed protein product [Toxocara canis]
MCPAYEFKTMKEARSSYKPNPLSCLQVSFTSLLNAYCGSAVIGSDSSDSISALLRSTSTSSINVSSEETQYSCPLQGSVKDIFDSDTCVTAISLSPFNEHQNRVVSQADLYADVTRRMDRIANTVNICVTAISLSPFNEHQNRVVSQADLYADVTRRMDRIANTVNM